MSVRMRSSVVVYDRDALLFLVTFYFFLFKQKTAYEMRISDWSSDVCSSDLRLHFPSRSCWIDAADPDHCKNRTRRPLSLTGVAHARGSAAACGWRQLVSQALLGSVCPVAYVVALAGNMVSASGRQWSALSSRDLPHRMPQPGQGIGVFHHRPPAHQSPITL